VLLVLMEVFLVIAILSHFNSLPTIKQLIFGGLAILLLYIIWRAVQAVSVLREQPGNQVAVIVAQPGRLLCVSFDRTRMIYCKVGNMWASVLETPGNT
jgi:hypothetical protein